MPAKEFPIRLSPEEDALLRKIYVQFRIPRDQYKRRPEELAAFIHRWNKLSGRDDEPGEVIRYIRNQQKAKSRLPVPWPTFKGTHKRAPEPSVHLDDKQLTALREIYAEIVIPLKIGVDMVEANEELCSRLSKEFAKRTGLIVPELTLVAIAEDKRKRGEWFRVGRQGWSQGIGFDDMDQIDKADDNE
jgi:hypothetical protein